MPTPNSLDTYDILAASPDIEDRLKQQLIATLKRRSVPASDVFTLPVDKLRQLFPDPTLLTAIYSWRCVELWKIEKLPDEAVLFHSAAKCGNLIAVRDVLMRHDMPSQSCRKYLIDHQDAANNRRTPLFDAAINGHPGIVRLLAEELHANVYIRDATDSLPVHLAAEMGRLHSVMCLTELFPDLLRFPDGADNTCLNRAALNGQIAVVEYLIAKRCYIENYGKSGRTPLLQAATNGYLAVVKFLVSKGADIFAKEPNSDKTAIHLAAEEGHSGVVAFFIETNPEFRKMETKLGKTPLDLARDRNQADVVRILETPQNQGSIYDNNARHVSLPLPSLRVINEEPIVTSPTGPGEPLTISSVL